MDGMPGGSGGLSSGQDSLATGGEQGSVRNCRKRRCPLEADEVVSPGLEDNVEEEDDDDGSWEDADTSEDEQRLKIDEPPKCKKAKQKKKVEIPDNILEECKRLAVLDKSLDLKAHKRKMNSKHVKMMIKQIISTDEFIALLRNAGLATLPAKEGEVYATAEPKMTRAMAKTLTEAGDVVPWIVQPVTPMKATAPEIVSLVTEDFPDEEEEEEKDPEYRPELDTRHVSEDEDSFLMSEQSDFGTPRTNRTTESTINTPLSTPGSNRLQTTPLGGFKRPMPGGASEVRASTPRGLAASRHLQFESTAGDNWEGYGTRSRRPMTEVNIDDLEQMFVPFDITPDMYDIPCDNDDYAEFLKTLYAGTGRENNTTQDDESLDPEYRFQEDEEYSTLRDPEELRNDRATKISRREVADLMSELLECANQDLDSIEESENRKQKQKANKKKKFSQPNTPQPQLLSPEPPSMSGPNAELSGCVGKERTPPKYGQGEVLEEQGQQTSGPAECTFSPAQLQELHLQVKQHVQLLAQMSILATGNPTFHTVKQDCSTMLTQLSSIAEKGSVLAVNTLAPSIDAIASWEGKQLPPTRFWIDTKNRVSCRKPKPVLSPECLDYLVDTGIFLFPSLLPLTGLVSESGRSVWTKGEDQLVAQALEKITSDMRRSSHQVSTKDLAHTIHNKFMQAKTPHQIRLRIKNLRASLQSETNPNPLTYYFQHGKTLPVKGQCEVAVPESDLGTTVREMVYRGRRDDIPVLYMGHILNPIKEALKGKGRRIEPKEVMVVEPDFPDMGSGEEEEEDDEDEEEREEGIERTRNNRLQPPAVSDCRLNPPVCAVATPPREMLCVDGNTGTPSSMSDSDTPGSNLDTLHVPRTMSQPTTPPSQRQLSKSPLKNCLTGLASSSSSSSSAFIKSPLKAASDRILKKYTAHVSPHKRPFRQLRKRVMFSPVKQAVTPRRRRVGARGPSSVSTPPSSRGSVATLAQMSPAASSAVGETAAEGVVNSPARGGVEEEPDTPTAAAKRKARQQREKEVTTRILLGKLETDQEKEARENRECMEMYTQIMKVTDTSPQLSAKYKEIIGRADTAGSVKTYLELHSLLAGYPEVQDLLLDLLSPGEAVTLGGDLYTRHSQRCQMKQFVIKLGIVYRHQPAYHVKVLKELDSLCKEPSSLTPELLKKTGTRLFKNNQHLLDEFLMLVPGIEPPESMIPSPEIINFPDDSDGSWEGLEAEQMYMPRSPTGEKTTGPRIVNTDPLVTDGNNAKGGKGSRKEKNSAK